MGTVRRGMIIGAVSGAVLTLALIAAVAVIAAALAVTAAAGIGALLGGAGGLLAAITGPARRARR